MTRIMSSPILWTRSQRSAVVFAGGLATYLDARWREEHPPVTPAVHVTADALRLRLVAVQALLDEARRLQQAESFAYLTSFPFRFLLLTTLIGYRRVAAEAWYSANRPTPPAALRTFYVDGDAAGGGDGTIGTPWNNWESVRTNAVAGDLYYFKGTFAETATSFVFNGTWPVGTASAWIQFKAWPTFTPTTVGNDGGYAPFELGGVAQDYYYWIEGFNLDCEPGTCVDAPLSLNLARHVVVKDCTMTSKNVDASILMKGASDIWIEGCTIADQIDQYAAIVYGNWAGIAKTASNITIYNCTTGIGYHSSIEVGLEEPYVTGVRVGFNTVTNPAAAGITGGTTDGRIVEGNVVIDTGDNFEALQGFDVLSLDGIYVIGRNGIYRYNIVTGGRKNGFFMQASDSASLPNDCADNAIYHNVAYDNGGAAVTFEIQGATLDLDVTGNSIANNIFWNNNSDLKGPTLSVTSITRSGTTATLTTDTAHGLVTGSNVDILGANEANFNGTLKTITKTGASSFTYTVADSGATTATGTITCYRSGNGTPGFVLDFYFSGGTATTRAALGLPGNVADIILTNLWVRNNLIGHDIVGLQTTYPLRIFGATDESPHSYTEAEAISQFGADFANNAVWDDPLFVSTDIGDLDSTYLAIDTGSPAIDTAQNIDGYASGAAPDMGLFEFDQGEAISSAVQQRRRLIIIRPRRR